MVNTSDAPVILEPQFKENILKELEDLSEYFREKAEYFKKLGSTAKNYNNKFQVLTAVVSGSTILTITFQTILLSNPITIGVTAALLSFLTGLSYNMDTIFRFYSLHIECSHLHNNYYELEIMANKMINNIKLTDEYDKNLHNLLISKKQLLIHQEPNQNLWKCPCTYKPVDN